MHETKLMYILVEMSSREICAHSLSIHDNENGAGEGARKWAAPYFVLITGYGYFYLLHSCYLSKHKILYQTTILPRLVVIIIVAA